MISSTLKYLKKSKFISLIFAILGTLFIMAATNQKQSKAVVIPVAESSYKTIIFDLNGVLLSTTSTAKNYLILHTLITNPTLLYYLVNFDTKVEYFKLLHEIPAKADSTMYHQSKPMPQIMVDWQTGLTTPEELKNKVIAQIQGSTHPTPIQNLFIAIAEFMFSPQTLADSQIPINSMVRLAQKLKKSGYQLFALSNWDSQSFEILYKNHPEIFKLFDGILISGQEKIGKPSQEFYQALLAKHNLNPSDCIFIDDEQQNIQTAQNLGIQSILCHTSHNVIEELITLGVLTRQL